jgi:hypothetical protein
MDEVTRVAIELLLSVLSAELLSVATVALGVAGNPSVSGAVTITRQIRGGRSPFKANVIRCQLLFVAGPEYLGRQGFPRGFYCSAI